MLYRGLLATDLSGSLDGIVASHNRGGTYFRNRAIPVNPNTVFQQAVRTAMSVLVTAWNDDLTQVQRDDWETYAAAVEVTNRIGASIFLTGQQMYIRTNVVAIQVGLPRQDDAPVDFNLGSFTTPDLTSADATANTLVVAFTDADDWANEDDSAMLVYGSRPVNPTVNFFKGPYRFAGRIDGDGVTPPTSPESIASPFALSDGQRVFVQIRVLRADGRLSSVFRDTVLVSTA